MNLRDRSSETVNVWSRVNVQFCSHRSYIVESYCVPDFDSPSVFARILDKDKVRRRRCPREIIMLTCSGWPFLHLPESLIHHKTELLSEL